jgi:predicted house-cleaning noncanonical NTP pyrophosphatase (MazG superfamily)
MEAIYNKLVRDKIAGIIEASGRTPICRFLSSKDYWEALLNKDSEELEEVRNASTGMEIIEELSDKLEVLIAMAEFHGFGLQDMIACAEKKKKERGGFDRRIFLEKVVKKD